MKLTRVLCSPPKFHYYRDFGAGKKRRIPFYKQWWNTWRYEIARKPIGDCTIPVEKLPPGSRLMNAEDFMEGPIDFLPEDLMKMKETRTLIDHPWPYNVELDPIKNQEPMFNYSIDSRFFVPRDDAQVLTNTLIESDELGANPPFEPTDEQMETVQRQYDWATKGDSVLVRQPRRGEFPRIDQRPKTKFGITKERKEVNVMGSLYDFSQNLVAQHLHKQQEGEKLSELLDRRSIAFPHCQVPIERDSQKLNLQLCIDQLAISNSPLPLVDPEPEKTSEKEAISIEPRGWRSLLEKSRNYSPAWSFTLPRNSHLHTIQLASRIKRDHRDSDEMLARSMIHAFALAMQYSRLRYFEKQLTIRSDESKLASVVLQDPLGIEAIRQHDHKDLLDQPIVLQTIAFDMGMKQFHFMRYQFNTANFSAANKSIKNQAWHSGPISDLSQVFRYYLDFQCFSSKNN